MLEGLLEAGTGRYNPVEQEVLLMEHLSQQDVVAYLAKGWLLAANGMAAFVPANTDGQEGQECSSAGVGVFLYEKEFGNDRHIVKNNKKKGRRGGGDGEY